MKIKSHSNNTEGISYLALGDSYTIGEGVTEPERYPNLLSAALSNKGICIYETKIIARTGWTTGDLKHAIRNADLSTYKYNMVSLLIGVNNQFQDRTLDEYKEDFTELLQIAVKLANGKTHKVFVISIPDYGHTPFGKHALDRISSGIDLFNKTNKQITDSMEIKYFDITPISKKGLSHPSLVADDGLHPSGLMYQEWVDLMLADVVAIARLP